MKPGTTVMPWASMMRVRGPASRRRSALLPTATKRPCSTANASARGRASSMV